MSDADPMTATFRGEDEATTADLAGRIAACLKPGDTIILSGPLGAGKSTLARAILRALGETGEVPSPTFTLIQTYEPDGAPAPVHHVDCYRLEGPDDALELGLEDAFATDITLIEWAERIEAILPANRLDVVIAIPEDAEGDAERVFELRGFGHWSDRLSDLFADILEDEGVDDGARLGPMMDFMQKHGWEDCLVYPIADDASFRRYFRAQNDDGSVVIMDAPPDHEDVRPFVTIANHLVELGFSAPKVLAEDAENGFLLLEDLGDDTFTRVLEEGGDETALYEAAVDVLIDLHTLPTKRAVPPGTPPYGNGRLLDEAFLLPQWFVATFTGEHMDEDTRRAYGEAWLAVFPKVHALQKTLVLRDYHVDNLIWLPDRAGIARVGLLDFQDAVSGCPAYDLMSLLEDARRDIAPDLKDAMMSRYLAAFADLDRAAFADAFTVLAAQRHAKVIGIFTRLCVRDGKDAYLEHIPRVWRLLEGALQTPVLADVRAWFDTHIPADRRIIPPVTGAAP